MEKEDLRTLYEAAKRGCVETLNRLIQRDQFLLNKVSLTSFSETPLHVSSLLGHFHFTTAVLEFCPRMTTTLDSLQRSPLHLASAQGHADIVKALLDVNKGVCLVRDEDGRIPLHLAAMRGNVEAIQELVSACPESIRELLDGDTVLHLCVTYNRLEALKLLVRIGNDNELLILANRDGNTIFHLAALLKQSKTIKYLLSLPEVKERMNSLNGVGLTALDVLDQQSWRLDWTSHETLGSLGEADAKRSVEVNRNFQSTAAAVSGRRSYGFRDGRN